MPGSGRRPINAPAGGANAAGVPWVGLGILFVLLLILAAFVAYFFFDVGKDGEGSGSNGSAPAVSTGTEGRGSVSGHSSGSLGYPLVATRNTTRISGTDPVDISLAAALAAYPTQGPGTPPAAVTLVSADQWQAGIVAASLSAAPINAPVLLAPSGKLSEAGESVIADLNPTGAPETGENQIFTVGKVAPPSGFSTNRINSQDTATLAVNVAKVKRELKDEPPGAIVIVSSEDAEFATPAATWAARSGDVVLFTGKDEVPEATLDFLDAKENKDVPTFILGPDEVVSSKAFLAIRKVSKKVERVEGDDPVSNALALVQFSSGSFGWNLNTPGHGFTIARADRPMDAIAATALSTGGTWPALLLTDSATKLAKPVHDYLLDVKPGYDTDPTLALYNHVWIIGDESLIDINQQAIIDDAAELAPVETLTTE